MTEDLTATNTVVVNGETYTVKPFDAYAAKLAESQSTATEDERINIAYRLTARAVGLPFDEVWGTEDKVGFPMTDVLLICAMASKGIRKVEASAPPFSEVATETAGV